MGENKHKTRNKRPTIGYLAPQLQAHLSQWAGIVDATQKHDVNLICFPGWSPGYPSGFLAQANILYDLVSTENVDGLVAWISSIGNYMTAEDLLAFCERYRPLPMVSIGRALEGIPSLLMDSYEGMREAIAHLIETHGYRHLAFIRGPESHFYAQERYRAYTETLGVYGIPLDLNLVTPPAIWGPDTGSEMMQLLLDERKLSPQTDFEAIIGVSDDTLLGALSVLRARGIRIPEDVAAVGFDDQPEGRTVTPPLTSVAAPFYEVGYRSVETLLTLMEGKQVLKAVTVPSKLVVRQSCGCLSSAVAQIVAERPPVADRAKADQRTFEAILTARREEILAEMARATGELGSRADPAWARRLLDGFGAELSGESKGAFLVTLDEVLRQVGLAAGKSAGESIATMQNAISALRRSTLPHADIELLVRAEDLWQQARVVIGETAQRVQASQQLRSEHRTQVLREIGRSLITTFDMGELIDVLTAGLPRLEIPGAYLALYENPQPYTYPQRAPDWSWLVLAFPDIDRPVELPPEGLRFPSQELAPVKMWPDRRYSYVVESLYFREHQIGFALFEMGPREEDVYDVLRGEISSALEGYLLVEQVKQRAVQLQTAAEVSQATSSILEPELLIEQVVELVRKRFDLYYVGLFLIETAPSPGDQVERRWAVLKAGTGEAGRQMVAQGHRLLVGGDSMIGQCTESKTARSALDVGEEAVRFENPLLSETRSELALPLVSRGEVVGALTIQSSREAAFSEEDISVFQTMASQLANAVQNAQLYARAQEAYAEVEQQIRERTAELQREIAEREKAQEESLRLQMEVIDAQKRAIQELSTPIIPVLESIIVMPLIGSVDSLRARELTRRLLTGIREHRARVAILDITGVPIVDSGVVSHLNKTIQAARLKGARTIVTGISDAVAETIVDLGIDWTGIDTLADLQTGLRAALTRLRTHSKKG